MDATASTAPLYGLSDLLLTDEQIPSGFALNRDWSGPINRHYEGPTFEAPGFIRDEPDNPSPATKWPYPPRSVEAQTVKPHLVELGLQGGYARRWDEVDFDPATMYGQDIYNRVLELRDTAAALQLTSGLGFVDQDKNTIAGDPAWDPMAFAPPGTDPATYKSNVTHIGATWLSAEFCVDRFVCSVNFIMRSRTEAEDLAQQLIAPYVRFVHDADPANRLQ